MCNLNLSFFCYTKEIEHSQKCCNTFTRCNVYVLNGNSFLKQIRPSSRHRKTHTPLDLLCMTVHFTKFSHVNTDSGPSSNIIILNMQQIKFENNEMQLKYHVYCSRDNILCMFSGKRKSFLVIKVIMKGSQKIYVGTGRIYNWFFLSACQLAIQR